MWHGPGGWMTGPWAWVFAVFAALFWLLILGTLVWLVIWLIRQTGPAGRESPLDILKTRYARGEISRDEYERMRQELS